MKNVNLSQEDFSQIIIDESKRTARLYKKKSNHIDSSELESWLVSEIFISLQKYPHMSNLIGIRSIAKRRTVNYIKKIARNNIVTSMEGIKDRTKTIMDTTTDMIFNDHGLLFASTSPIEEYHKKDDVYSFLETLKPQERLITELLAGITDNLNHEQLKIVKAIIEESSVCTCKNDKCKCTFTTYIQVNDIAEILEIHRNTIKNTMKKVKQKAIRFGLEPISSKWTSVFDLKEHPCSYIKTRPNYESYCNSGAMEIPFHTHANTF